MNILISTTTNWNPGDFIILKGVKNILKHIYPDANYINYDRNPNNMIDWPNNQNMKCGLHGNFMNNPINWSIIDLVVLAGSPEFLHHPLAPIYEGLADHPEIPLWAIGVGYSEPQFMLPFTEAEKIVLTRENTILIVRQQELSNRLQDTLHIPVTTLPCPALFCFESFPKKTNKMMAYMGCHSLQELDENMYFSSDPYDMLNFIGSHHHIISERLHAVIAGISSGAWAMLENPNFRTAVAVQLFDPVLESHNPDHIQEFKNKHLTNYLNILKNETKH
jgi:hypothetical protein